MLTTLLRIAAVLALVGIGGEFLSPPLSCWVLNVVAPRDGAGGDGANLLARLGGGIATAVQRLAETPLERSGSLCRARLVGGAAPR